MIIIEGGPQEFSAIAYGVPHPGTVQFLQQQVMNLNPNLTPIGRRFMEQSREVFERFNGSRAIQATKAALRTLQYGFDPNTIRPLTTMGQLQHAPPVMQRWIIAQPEVRRWYNANRLDGYSESYVDMYPGTIGPTHEDYRDVMSGIIQDMDEGYKKVTYATDSEEMDLTLLEKTDIFETWLAITARLKAGQEDPTSIFAANM